jgi:hypothetical protein
MKARRTQPLEHDIQAAFVRWCSLSEAAHPELRVAFAVPNAAKRSPALAAKMKAEGLRAGVWDWWLPVPRAGFTGLVIEFKRSGGTLSQPQRDYCEQIRRYGWRCRVCFTTASAVEEVKSYLGVENDLWRVALGDCVQPTPGR